MCARAHGAWYFLTRQHARGGACAQAYGQGRAHDLQAVSVDGQTAEKASKHGEVFGLRKTKQMAGLGAGVRRGTPAGILAPYPTPVMLALHYRQTAGQPFTSCFFPTEICRKATPAHRRTCGQAGAQVRGDSLPAPYQRKFAALLRADRVPPRV